jgi:hypothetical protein
VDGATNGTRKLNAYSPTFGGNLTVSGTGSFTGQINGSSGYQFRAADNTAYELLRYAGGSNNPGLFIKVVESTKKVTLLASGSLVAGQTIGIGAEGSEALTIGASNATLAGNLTVSGTGTSSVAGNFGLGTTTPTAGQLHISGNSDSGSAPNRPRIGLTNLAGTAQTWTIQAWQTSGDANLSIYRTAAAGGILLASTGGSVGVGVTSFSGSGALELATHTTSAGGIGFGTDTSLYRQQNSQLCLDATGGLSLLQFRTSGTYNGRIGHDGTNFEVRSVSGSVLLISNSTTALTLDSSQNATFAGNITVNGAGPYTLKSRTIINRSDNTSATFGHVSLTRGTGAGTTAALATTGDASNGVASVSLQLSDADRFVVTSAGTVVLGTQASLATNATDGFTYIPVSAGAPTGTPTAYTGKVAMEYDTTNNKLYIYNGGWKSVTLA